MALTALRGSLQERRRVEALRYHYRRRVEGRSMVANGSRLPAARSDDAEKTPNQEAPSVECDHDDAPARLART